MNNMKMLAIAGVVVLVVLIGGAFLLTNKAQNSPVNQTNTTNSSPTESQTSANNSAKNEETIVTITANGFEPAVLNINAGTKVTWVNTSGATANVSSDIHPTHLLYPFLNLGDVNNGSSVSVVVEKAGTYTYHNHLNPSQKGTIIAK